MARRNGESYVSGVIWHGKRELDDENMGKTGSWTVCVKRTEGGWVVERWKLRRIT